MFRIRDNSSLKISSFLAPDAATKRNLNVFALVKLAKIVPAALTTSIPDHFKEMVIAFLSNLESLKLTDEGKLIPSVQVALTTYRDHPVHAIAKAVTKV